LGLAFPKEGSLKIYRLRPFVAIAEKIFSGCDRITIEHIIYARSSDKTVGVEHLRHNFYTLRNHLDTQMLNPLCFHQYIVPALRG
jgi:hypothetical protein